jgi:hypothetical protein
MYTINTAATSRVYCTAVNRHSKHCNQRAHGGVEECASTGIRDVGTILDE